MRHEDPDRDVLVRGYAVTHPSGTVVPPQPPGWDQLLLAASGVMTVDTATGHWVVPPHRALWVPAGERHRIVLAGRARLRNLYFREGLVGLAPSCRAVNVPPLVRELVLHLVAVAPLWAERPDHARLVGVLADQLVTLPAAPLQLPLPADAAARAVAELLLAELEGSDPGDPVSLGELSRRAGASRRTIERRFRDETGMGPAAWRQRARLLRALRLLATGASVSSVAVAVGYSTPSAFGAMFLEAMGTTPARYFAAPGGRRHPTSLPAEGTTEEEVRP